MNPRRGAGVVLLAAVVLLLPACRSGSSGRDSATGSSLDAQTVAEIAGEVLTLQSGTITELKALRGRGPFRRYDVAPDRLLEVVARAARKARGLGGERVAGVWASRHRSEVIAKERAPEDAHRTSYSLPWYSAMVATVHPVLGEEQASRLEIHSTHKGPFHRGAVDWERDLPRWIDEILNEPPLLPGGIRPLR